MVARDLHRMEEPVLSWGYGCDGKFEIDGLGGSYGVETLILYRILPETGPPETTCWETEFVYLASESDTAGFIAAIGEGRRSIGDVVEAVGSVSGIEPICWGCSP